MIYNLTPHSVAIADDKGEIVRKILPWGEVVRLSSTVEAAGEIDGIPVVRTKFGDPVGIPADLKPGDVLVVSTLALPHVAAVVPPGVTAVSPDTGPDSAVRDENGRIVAVRRFQTV